jgi:hypothetical protein
MKLSFRIAGFLLICGCLFPETGTFSQDSGTVVNAENMDSIPEGVRRPQGGEAPRYPRDVVIGELGRGMAENGAYLFARNMLSAMVQNDRDSRYLSGLNSALAEDLFINLGQITPRQYRIGEGREEPDGSTSFLFRLVGRELDMSGELYVRNDEQGWHFEDLLVEKPRTIEGRGTYNYDFAPYERFF